MNTSDKSLFTKGVSREAELLAQNTQAMFEALFEVLELSPQELEKIQHLCDAKMLELRNDEQEIEKIFLRLVQEEDHSQHPT